jgi:hypothetical protein
VMKIWVEASNLEYWLCEHFQPCLGHIRNRWYCKICEYIRGAISLRPSAVARSRGGYAYQFNYQGKGVVIIFYFG